MIIFPTQLNVIIKLTLIFLSKIHSAYIFIALGQIRTGKNLLLLGLPYLRIRNYRDRMNETQ